MSSNKRKAETSGDEGKPAKRARGDGKSAYQQRVEAFDDFEAKFKELSGMLATLRKLGVGKPPAKKKDKEDNGAESPAEDEPKPKKTKAAKKDKGAADGKQADEKDEGEKKTKAAKKDKGELTEEEAKRKAEKAAKRKAKRAEEKAAKAAKEAKTEVKPARDDGKCSSCEKDAANAQFDPCGHSVLCGRCADDFKFGSPCPTCKGQVSALKFKGV